MVPTTCGKEGPTKWEDALSPTYLGGVCMTEQQMENAAKRLYVMLDKIIPQMGEVVSNDSESYAIEADVAVKPFDVHLKVEIHKENGMITIYSVLPYDVPEEIRESFASYIAGLNYDNLYLGCFDYSPARGKIVFRTTIVYRDSLISEITLKDVLEYVVNSVCKFNEDIFNHTRIGEKE